MTQETSVLILFENFDSLIMNLELFGKTYIMTTKLSVSSICFLLIHLSMIQFIWGENLPKQTVVVDQSTSAHSIHQPLLIVYQLTVEGRLTEALETLNQILSTVKLDPTIQAQALDLKKILVKTIEARQPQARSLQKQNIENAQNLELNGKKLVQQRMSEGLEPSSGARTALIGTTTLLGLSLYGPTLVSIPGIESTRLKVGSYTLGASMALATPLLLYGKKEVTWGMSDLGFTGFTRGAIHGALFSGALEINDDFGLLASMSISSLIEGSLGLLYAQSAHLHAGETQSLAVGHDLGFAIGALLATPFNLSFPKASMLMLSTSLLGYVGGEFYRRHRETPWGGTHSWGNYELIRLSSILGLYGGGVFATQFDATQETTMISALLMMGGGAALGDLLAQKRLLSFNEALLIDLSTFGGGLLGTGLSYLLFSEISSDQLLLGSLAGALSGYIVSYRFTDALDLSRSSDEKNPPQVTLGPLWLPQSHSQASIRGFALSGQF